MSGDDPSARTRVDGPEATRSDPHTRSAPVAEVRVGRYAVLETLGRGGMGIVFRAYDPKLRREVAIKRLHKSVVGEKTGARLVREAQALAQLSHPNVVAVYDVEAGDAGVLMVMELVRGMTLQDWLAEDERGAAPVLDLFLRAGRGLAAAHREGLVHRDFKPANVMVDVSTDVPIVKVTDFGLARALGPGQTDPPDPTDAALASPDLDAPLTEAGVVMGTPRYMAPEQHTGRATDGRTDQYAFCIALWEALAGSPPFPLDETLAKRKLKGPPAWPRSALGGDPIGAVVVRGLAADPDARWPSMEALLGALAPTQSTSRAAWVVGAALLATIGSAVAFATGRADALCTGAQAELDGTWDQSRKAAVEATILATKLPYAEATLTAVQESLDAYAASWVAQHTDACRATSVRGDQSAAAMDLRMRCLRRAKVRLLAATDLLVEADATIVEGAVALTNDLPDPERCGDLDALQEGPPPPAASIAEAVEAATTELATASSLYSAGKYAQAADAAQTVFDAATELDYA
ncbi:MAG: serine/threonine-protein kinase, partial [Myxococcota bacterium]